LKTKTAFEVSGSSPHSVSENGATLLTGRGLESVRSRIEEAFRLIHNDQPAPVKVEKQKDVYSEAQEQRFHARVKVLVRSASLLNSPQISKSRHRSVWEIKAPTQTAEELINEILRASV